MDRTIPFRSTRRARAASCLIVGIFLLGLADQTSAIEIEINGTNALLTWTGTNLWPQANPNLGESGEWQNLFGAFYDGSGFALMQPATSDQMFFRLVPSPFLPPPTRLFLDGRDDQFFLYWDVVASASGYNLYYSTEAGISQSNYLSKAGGTKLSGISNTSLSLSNLTAGQTYHFVVTATNNAGESIDSLEVFGAYGPRSEIHGTIYTELVMDGGTNQIFLPDVTVYVVNQSNLLHSVSMTTDSRGSFVIPGQPPGNYQLCWNANGFVPGCSTQEIAVVDTPVYLEPQKIEPVASSGLVYGRVRMGDGRAPFQSDAFFEINVNAEVALHGTNGGVVARATPNSLGEYVLAGASPKTSRPLTAQVEGAQVLTNINTLVTGQADLVVPNLPPVIHSLSAVWNGQPTNRVSPGATVTLVADADDPDAGDVLQYRWFAGQNAGGLVDTNLPTNTFTVSNTPQAVVLFVRVSDGHGGYTTERLDLAVIDDWLFSGYVVDTNNLPIANANVRLGGNVTFSDTNGYFSFTVPASQAAYPLAISAPGYLPLFRHLTAPITEVSYVLAPVASSFCTEWDGGAIALQDGSGISLQLQTSSLTNAAGSSYVGQICVTMANYDPCDFAAPFPAGNTAMVGPGQPAFLTPVAAALIQITDGTNELFIRGDAPALLTLPRGITCAPPTNEPSMLPSWELDPNSGLWLVGGQANRQTNPDTSLSFVGPVVQLGLLAVGQAAPVCKVTVVPDRTLNLPFHLRVSELRDPVLIELSVNSRNFEVPQNKEITIEVLSHKEAPGVYFTNPLDTNTLRKVENKTAIVQVKKTFTTNTDGVALSLSKHLPALRNDRVSDNDHFLTYRSTGTLAGGPFPNGDAYYGATVGAVGVFDKSPYLINNYKFRDFLIKNKFLDAQATSLTNYTEDTSAFYYNAQDLGFVRSMHMKRSAGADGKTNIAYFVVNYFRFEDALVDHEKNGKLKGLSAQIEGRQVAIVAMDYAWDPRWQKRYTKFYVFDGGLFGNLRPDVDLDGADNKPVPNLCVNCHARKPVTVKRLPVPLVWPNGRGGEINASYLRTNLNFSGFTLPVEKAITNLTWIDDGTTALLKGRRVPSMLVVDPPDGDTGARFLPFDLESFTYEAGIGVTDAQFRELNRGIYLYTPRTTAMTQLLEGWYGGALNAANNNPFTASFVPAAWSGEANLYRDVVKVTCRACHCTREGGLGFAAAADFTKRANSLHSQICADLTMPNAQRTFSIFWGSRTANIIKPGAVADQIHGLTNRFSWTDCPTP